MRAVNTLAAAGSALLYVFLYAFFTSRYHDFLSGGSGSAQISGRLQMYLVPLLLGCLAAALAGAALGLALGRTRRPFVFCALLGGTIAAYHWTSTTVMWRNLDPESFAWVLLHLLLPAVVATAVAAWLARRRRPAASAAGPAPAAG